MTRTYRGALPVTTAVIVLIARPLNTSPRSTRGLFEGWRSAFAHSASFGEIGVIDSSLRTSLPSRSSPTIQASEGWLGVRDDFRNWFVEAV